MTIKQLYPTQRPALDLNFARQKRLDPRISFTRTSTATYVGSNGLIKTAASGEPRFDHDPTTGESLGLLIEESRTNLVIYSEDLTQSNWLKYGVTITSNAVVAPDGNTSADKMFSTAGAALLAVQQAKTGLTNAAQYTRSVFFKAAELTSATMQIGGTTEGTILCVVDLSNGTSTNGGVVTAYQNGWYKVERTFTMSGTTNDFYLRLPNSSSTNDGVYVWGAQLEAGSFPTSYIPTSSAAVTRSADVASMTGTNFSSWYNQSEGALTFTGSPISSNAFDGFYFKENNTNYHGLILRTSGSLVRKPTYRNNYINVTEVDLQGSNLESGDSVKVAATYKNNDFAFSQDGGAAQLDVTGTLSSPTTFLIGQFSGSNQYYYSGHISRLAYYPTRLPDDQLQALTL